MTVLVCPECGVLFDEAYATRQIETGNMEHNGIYQVTCPCCKRAYSYPESITEDHNPFEEVTLLEKWKRQ